VPVGLNGWGLRCSKPARCAEPPSLALIGHGAGRLAGIVKLDDVLRDVRWWETRTCTGLVLRTHVKHQAVAVIRA